MAENIYIKLEDNGFYTNPKQVFNTIYNIRVVSSYSEANDGEFYTIHPPHNFTISLPTIPDFPKNVVVSSFINVDLRLVPNRSYTFPHELACSPSNTRPVFCIKFGEYFYISYVYVETASYDIYQSELWIHTNKDLPRSGKKIIGLNRTATSSACLLYQDGNNDIYMGFLKLSHTSTSSAIFAYPEFFNLSELARTIGDFEIIEDPDHNYPTPSIENGYDGIGDHSSDIIIPSPQPSISISNIGLINVYHPDKNGLQNFVNDLFPDIDFPTFSDSGDITDIVDNIGKVGESIVKGIRMTMNEKLLDYVLDVHLLPVSPIDSTNEYIKVGYTTSTVTAPKIENDYIDFDCGTIKIPEVYGSFIDYSCTRCKLYLPFVGYVPINNEYYQNGELSVLYRFNVLDGSFVAFIMSTSSKSQLKNSLIGTYSGNCCVHIPISATSFSNVISGVVGGVNNMQQGITSGNAVQSVEGALQTVTSKPNLMLNNGYNATSSYLGHRYPYLIIERATPCYPSTYKEDNGFPSYITKKLLQCNGLLSCKITNVNIDNHLCDDIDREEIKTLLNDYIII